MNKWESEFARILDARERTGEIAAWAFEPMRFILAPRTTYCPDFMIVCPDRTLEFVEVKGHQRDDAMAKFKIAAAQNPWFTWRMVTRVKGEWTDVAGYVFVGGVPVRTAPSALPTKRVVPITTPRPMSYDAMSRDAVLGPVLRMKPADLYDLRMRLCLSRVDMAERLGMTPSQYMRIESGQISLYHHRHVLAIKKLMEDE